MGREAENTLDESPAHRRANIQNNTAIQTHTYGHRSLQIQFFGLWAYLGWTCKRHIIKPSGPFGSGPCYDTLGVTWGPSAILIVMKINISVSVHSQCLKEANFMFMKVSRRLKRAQSARSPDWGLSSADRCRLKNSLSKTNPYTPLPCL